MAFNGCLIGNWCVGHCEWNSDKIGYRGICMYDPKREYDELMTITDKDEFELKLSKSLEDVWGWEVLCPL